MTFATVAMPINIRKDGAFALLGNITIHVPLLADLIKFVTSEYKTDDKGTIVMDEGIPVYKDDEANWIMGAILSEVKASARGVLKPGTIEVKDGNKIPETWAELCADRPRGPGIGAEMASKFKKAFAEWVSKQGLSENATVTLVTLVSNKPALSLQPDGMKAKVKARLQSFAETLDEASLEFFMRPLTAAQEACDATMASAADEF